MAFIQPHADLPPINPYPVFPDQQPPQPPIPEADPSQGPGGNILDVRYIQLDSMRTMFIDPDHIDAVVINAKRLLTNLVGDEEFKYNNAYNYLREVMPASVDDEHLKKVATGFANDDLEGSLGIDFINDEEGYFDILFRAQLICGSIARTEAGLYGVYTVDVDENGDLVQTLKPIGAACMTTDPTDSFTTFQLFARNDENAQLGEFVTRSSIPGAKVLEMLDKGGNVLGLAEYLEDAGWELAFPLRSVEGRRGEQVAYLFNYLYQAGVPTGSQWDYGRFVSIMHELNERAKEEGICQLPLEVGEDAFNRQDLKEVITFAVGEGETKRDYALCVYGTNPNLSSYNEDVVEGFWEIARHDTGNLEAIFDVDPEEEGALYYLDGNERIKIVGEGVTPVVFDITDWEGVVVQLEEEEDFPLPYVVGGLAALFGTGIVGSWLIGRYRARQNSLLARATKNKPESIGDLVNELLENYEGAERGQIDSGKILTRLMNVKGDDIGGLFETHRMVFLLSRIPEAKQIVLEEFTNLFAGKYSPEELSAIQQQIRETIEQQGTKSFDSKGGLVVNALKRIFTPEELDKLANDPGSLITRTIAETVKAEIKAGQAIKLKETEDRQAADRERYINEINQNLRTNALRGPISEAVKSQAIVDYLNFRLGKKNPDMRIFSENVQLYMNSQIDLRSEEIVEKYVFNLGEGVKLNVAVVRYIDDLGEFQERIVPVIM